MYFKILQHAAIYYNALLLPTFRCYDIPSKAFSACRALANQAVQDGTEPAGDPARIPFVILAGFRVHIGFRV